MGAPFVSVICEYNPFHKGHLYQLNALKEKFGKVVCILSGNLVQRGSIAVADKYIRAEAAVNAGADLVVELPIPYCCASAKDFAEAGAYICEALGSDYLAFGAEDAEDLKTLYGFIGSEEFSDKLRDFRENHKDISYPASVGEIIKSELGEAFAEKIKKPNNVLSLEYLKALKTAKPVILKREPSFKSSSEIRALGKEEIFASLPKESAEIFKKCDGFPREESALDNFYIGSLIGGLFEKEYYSVTADLKNKILKAARSEKTVKGIVNSCTDKIYTSARVRRAINSLVFGITPEMIKEKPNYINVLAIGEGGKEILKNAKKSGNLKIVTKISDAKRDEKVFEKFSFSARIEKIISLADGAENPRATDVK